MIENVYPLSHLQEGLYYHWLSSPDSPAYFLQMSYRMKGGLDITTLEKTYHTLVERHAVLRTFFTQDFGEQVLQVVRKEANPVFIYKDLTGAPQTAVEEYKAADRAKGFNLQAGSQMRLCVLFLGDDTYEFIWSHHHIIMDGWCVGILMKEFFQVYAALAQATTPDLGKAYPYSSYIEWLTKTDKEHSTNYWRAYLSGFDAITGLPKLSASSKEYIPRETSFQLSSEVTQAIKEICRQYGVTENTFFQAVWAVLLSKYNNTNDVVFGAIVSGRPAEVKGIEEMIGLFINTIPVRVQVDSQSSFADLLKEVQAASIEGIDHHYTQLAQIQSESELGQNLFDHLIQFQNFPVQEVVSDSAQPADGKKGLSLENFSMAGHNTYDFTCLISPREVMDFTFMYNAARYSEANIRQLQLHLTKLVNEIAAGVTTPVSKLDYLSKEEKQQLLVGFNDTVVASFKAKTLVELFEQQARKTPELTAVFFDGKQLTYRELDEQSNKLANYLELTYNLQSGEPVGVMLDRSEGLVIAILAVFKAGATYVPIDPEYPDARKQYIMEDAGIKVLLTKTNYIFSLSNYTGSFFGMDVELDVLETPATPTGITVRPDDLAYIIYTSGSTGEPKGVMVEHGAVANTIQGHRAIFDLNEGDRSLQFASPSFDASITQVFVPLISGGALYIINDKQKKDPALLEQYITAHSIAYADIPPAYQKLMNTDSIGWLKKLGSGGEAAIPEKVNAFTKYGPYFNAYGPTEAAICATMFVVKKGQSFEGATVPIGKPIPNAQVYILHADKSLVPVGAVGEICIGGAGVARGYWNNAQLTAAKFIDSPFVQGEKIYCSGDLGRWLPDGNIEFMGRKDDQVKIRGYRIELGEIENALRTHSSVNGAVVLARANANGEKEIVAYVVPEEGVKDLQDITKYVTEILPEYMVPSHFVSMNEFPVNTNGKIDKKQLPDPSAVSAGTGVEYVAARNETEEKLVEIWQEILAKDQIGVRDDFFKLGGHSIKVVQLISRINSTFLVRIDIQSIFNDPTIENIAEQIAFIVEQNRQKENTANLVQIEI
jgi:amino acid adenylation domain-containing protein